MVIRSSTTFLWVLLYIIIRCKDERILEQIKIKMNINEENNKPKEIVFGPQRPDNIQNTDNTQKNPEKRKPAHFNLFDDHLRKIFKF